MSQSVITRAVVIFIFIVGISCLNSTRVLERVLRYIETRINTESQLRNEEYADVFGRLSALDKQLNVFTDNADQLRKDFKQIRPAFHEHTSETARIRREIPIIENEVTAVKHDLEYYCKKNRNKTNEIISRIKESDHVFKTDMLLNLNKIDELLSRAEESDDAFKTDMKFALQNTREEFKATVGQMEERMHRTVKEKVESIGLLVSQLSAGLKHLITLYDSCSGYRRAGALISGVYTLRQGLQVYFDQTTDGGGWLVFQRRQNGEVDFYRNWTEYKHGFGDLNGEFWLGNEHLSSLTAVGSLELRIDIEDFDGNRAYAKYSRFKIYPADDTYKLEVSGFTGNATDSLTDHHNGMAFSTFDNDNDKRSSNCANGSHGAWWYYDCDYSNLNGQYFNEPGKIYHKGINWYNWKREDYCLKYAEMKFS